MITRTPYPRPPLRFAYLLQAILLLGLTLWPAAAQAKKAHVCPADREVLRCLETPSDPNCNAVEQLNEFLKGEKPGDRPILAFDHEREVWVGGKFDATNTKNKLDHTAKTPITFDVNCVPKLDIGSGQDVLVVVFNTNPLLYLVEPGEIEEIEPEALAQLQQLAGLLGGNLSSVLQASQSFTLASASSGFHDPQLVKDMEQHLKARMVDVESEASKLEQPVIDLKNQLPKAAAVSAEIRLIQRAVEDRRNPGRLVQQVKGLFQNVNSRDTPLSELIDRGASKITRAKADITSNPATCLQGYEALALAIEFRLLGSDDKKKVEFQRNLDTLSKTTFLKQVDGCGLSNEAENLKKIAELLERWDPTGQAVPELKRNQGYPPGAIVKPAGWKPGDFLFWSEQGGKTGASKPSQPSILGDTFTDGGVTWTVIDWTEAMKDLQRSAETYTAIAEAFKTSLTQADALVAKAPDAAKVAGQLEELARRERRVIPETEADNVCPSEKCPGTVWALSTGVVPLLDGKTRLRWDRVQKRPFTIKVSAPFADEIARRRKDEVASEYKIRHRFFADFSIGVGVIYTEIADPTFTAVTNPLDEATAEGDDEEPMKVIARTDEDTRAGELALLLHYPLQPKERDGFFRFGFEAGAGLDADKPSFFIGPAFSFGKYVRLGVGWSWQQVKDLVDDQKELASFTSGEIDPASLTFVASDDDVRTRDRFEDDYYISLTFNLSSLSFFGGDSE